MKQFSIIKVGYSSGVYGCSGEYFTTIYTTKDRLMSFRFSGLYGAEERVTAEMKAKGYKESYNGVAYGKITGKDKDFYWSEQEAIRFVKSGFKSIDK